MTEQDTAQARTTRIMSAAEFLRAHCEAFGRYPSREPHDRRNDAEVAQLTTGPSIPPAGVESHTASELVTGPSL